MENVLKLSDHPQKKRDAILTVAEQVRSEFLITKRWWSNLAPRGAEAQDPEDQNDNCLIFTLNVLEIVTRVQVCHLQDIGLSHPIVSRSLYSKIWVHFQTQGCFYLQHLAGPVQKIGIYDHLEELANHHHFHFKQLTGRYTHVLQILSQGYVFENLDTISDDRPHFSVNWFEGAVVHPIPQHIYLGHQRDDLVTYKSI